MLKGDDLASDFLSTRELQDWLGLGRTKVFELLANGEIPSYAIGRRRIIRRSEVELWLEDHRYSPGK